MKFVFYIAFFLLLQKCMSSAAEQHLDDKSKRNLRADSGAWLRAHNKRREKYHRKYGVSYVPLQWSRALASTAQQHAEYMAQNNYSGHSGGNYGENIAKNGGGSPYSAEQVLQMWTEDEERQWGKHFTQVLWRATKYLGCGSASNGNDHYFVCQYVTPGNCNGSSKSNMLASTSPCEPQCPTDGC